MSNFNGISCFSSKIKILNRRITISDLNACEYGLSILDDTAVIIARIIDNKLSEIYCRYLSDKLVSVDSNGIFSSYKYTMNGKIIRDDGAVYVIDKYVIKRLGDNRVYTDAEITVKDIPDILYKISYYIYKNYNDFVNVCLKNQSFEFARDIITKVNLDADNKDAIEYAKKNSEVL